MLKKEDITFRDFILQINNWIKYLRSKWLVISAFSLLAAVAGFTWAYTRKPTYTANYTFVLSSESRSGGGLAALAGQLGYDVGGSSNDIFVGDNILELFKSNRIIKGALFRHMPDSSKAFANVFIENNGIEKDWRKIPGLEKAFPFPDDINKVTPLQDSLLEVLHSIVITKFVNIDKPNKKLSIYQLSVTSGNQSISYFLGKFILEEASTFYIETKTKLARLNLNMLQNEADSIRTILGTSIENTAQAIDEAYNLNPAYQVQRSGAQKSQVKVSVLSTAYAEIIRNLELAKITLQKETPLYQVIDEPGKLLQKNKVSKLITAISWGFVTALFVIIYLIVKRAFNIPQQNGSGKLYS